MTVAHYPPGTSKWNPIEHRLFSEIAKRWPGIPLDPILTILNCYNTTTTKTGLSVIGNVLEADYPRWIKISDEEMAQLNLEYNQTLPQWNYVLKPDSSTLIRDWDELLIG